MDTKMLEEMIADLLDEVFERLETKDRTDQVNVDMDGHYISVSIIDGTSTRQSLWHISARPRNN